MLQNNSVFRMVPRALAVLLFLFCPFGCSGPMMFTEYVDDMEVGEETVVYDGKGHPVIISEHGYVDDPYAESYSIEKGDFMRHGFGVLPE